MFGVTCDGLVSHPEGVAILLVVLCYGNACNYKISDDSNPSDWNSLRKSSAIFGNVRKMIRHDRTSFGQFFRTFRKKSKIFGKKSEIFSRIQLSYMGSVSYTMLSLCITLESIA